MSSSLIEAVSAVLRFAAAEAVLPRYCSLAAGDIEEKAPGELVTVADREAEAHIARGVAELVPGARFIGEEACARDPGLLDRIDEGAVWIVDPIDGTGNFAAGRPPFALMAALLKEGEIVASWLYDPLADRMAVAELGSGAWVDGERIRTSPDVPDGKELRGIISRFSLPDAMRSGVEAVEAEVPDIMPSRRCAGDEYPRIASGEKHFALYWRTLVWDHAPGVLFLREAGGVARRPNGATYVPSSRGAGLLLAQNSAIADAISALLESGTQMP